MKESNNQQPNGNANNFPQDQSDLDKAKNERIKEDGESANKKDDLTTKTDTARKKTGGGKQVSPGM